MSLGFAILFFGVLMFITPLMMTWLKFGRVTEHTIVQMMMQLNGEQAKLVRFASQSGVAFVFIGAAMLLSGF